MKTFAPSAVLCDESVALYADPKEQFRLRFQRSIGLCVRHGFCIEESFGMIFNETLDEVPLAEEDQAALYEEMIRWAKRVAF
ncbi:MAG TPA: hypothetical protein VEH27_07685 [Methylomirabilota bacterium]|nr:hypothetical protein [Methylomirabilota bacterium]